MPLVPIGEALIHPAPTAIAPAPRANPAKTEAPSGFSEVLHALGSEAERGEAMVRGVLRTGGGELGARELIALQAGIYRYGETVDLAAKLVDKAGTDLKTVLSGQQ